ncbi:MAG: class I SAM-dependent methyltransferase [Dehalococcoidia bacterium]|nr:class I SAM-dependent methyltransferase [Dehalococcoidia bacterium]
MAEPFYSRPSLHVEIYATRSASMPVVEGDIDFYLELARNAPGPALELGCGTARVALPLALEGIHVTGLDLSQPMLDVAKAEAAAAGAGTTLAPPAWGHVRLQSGTTVRPRVHRFPFVHAANDTGPTARLPQLRP